MKTAIAVGLVSAFPFYRGVHVLCSGRMKRIVHIIVGSQQSRDQPDLGKIVASLVTAQLEVGLDVSLWRIGREQPRTDNFSTTYPRQKNKFGLSPQLKEEIRVLKEGTIIHAHGGFVPEYFALSKFLKKSGRSLYLVLSSHGAYHESSIRGLSPFSKIYYYLFERPLVKVAKLIHLVGPAEVSGYNFYMDKMTPFVSLPIGLSGFDPVKSPNPVILKDNKTFVIACAGRLDIWRNGLDTLLQAFAKFTQEMYTPVELWMIGKGEDENNLKGLAKKLGIENKVNFYGALEDRVRQKYLQNSHVFVQASRIDYIPVAVLEAAAQGVPLIVSEDTNLGGYVRQYEAGWCLSRNSVEKLIEVLHEAFFVYQTDEVAFTKAGFNSYRMVRDELNWTSLARKWKEVYLSLFIIV